jgi:biopolymer transport protein ExbD
MGETVACRMACSRTVTRYDFEDILCPTHMHVHEHAEDRRRGDLQIRQAFIVTLTGFWTTVLVVIWAFTPLTASGVWPLLDIIELSEGRKAPNVEGDVFISITRTGDIYLEGRRASLFEITHACEMASRQRLDWRGESYQYEIFIRVDKAALYRSVRDVIRAVQIGKARQVTFLGRPANSELLIIYH